MLRESVYREEYQPGSTIFREGEPGDCAYVIERGMVQLETLRRGRRITIANLAEGDLFGEMALIDDQPRMASARATKPTTVIVVTRPMFQAKLDQTDPFIKGLLTILSDHVRDMSHHQAA